MPARGGHRWRANWPKPRRSSRSRPAVPETPASGVPLPSRDPRGAGAVRGVPDFRDPARHGPRVHQRSVPLRIAAAAGTPRARRHREGALLGRGGRAAAAIPAGVDSSGAVGRVRLRCAQSCYDRAVPAISSKLPSSGVSIFEVMSGLARQHDAVNLSQGFPDFGCPADLIDSVAHYMREGYNQYAQMPGVPRLREALAGKFEFLYGRRYDPVTEIAITTGATEALFASLTALVRPGDEV